MNDVMLAAVAVGLRCYLERHGGAVDEPVGGARRTPRLAGWLPVPGGPAGMRR